MTEFTPIPGVRYHPKGLSVTRDGVEEPLLLCYSPMREGDRVPFTDADLVDRWAWPEDREVVVIYNPHGEPRVETLWGVKPDWDDADDEDIVYSEGLYEYSPYTKEDARDRAKELGGTVVTRTITTTTITHKTEWTEVNE